MAAVSPDWDLTELNGARLRLTGRPRAQTAGAILSVSYLAELRPSPKEIFANLVDRNASLVLRSRITGGVPVAEFEASGGHDSAWALDSAIAAAAAFLGHPVVESGRGAHVHALNTGATELRVGDLITAVDSAPVDTAGSLSAALSGRQAATVTVSRRGVRRELRLARQLDGSWGIRVVTADRVLSHGVGAQFDLPTDLLGPSLGLACALSVIDACTDGQLARGGAIAATGTVDLAGRVGEVGAVTFKARAVRAHDRVTRFLIPAEPATDVAAARRVLNRGPEVVAVASLAEAVEVLRGSN